MSADEKSHLMYPRGTCFSPTFSHFLPLNDLRCACDLIQRNILDGELLATFQLMGATERQEICRKIGSTADTILDDLMEIERVTSYF